MGRFGGERAVIVRRGHRRMGDDRRLPRYGHRDGGVTGVRQCPGIRLRVLSPGAIPIAADCGGSAGGYLENGHVVEQFR